MNSRKGLTAQERELGSVEKGPDAFRTISEVADDLDLPQHVLRFWETRFPQIRPLKRGGGRRYYRPDDIELLRGIRHLLYSEGYTIRGVQRILKEEGPRYVQAIWRDAEAEALEVADYEDMERRQSRPQERDAVDAGHPGRGREAGGREGDGGQGTGRGGALSGLLNLLPSRQREAARDGGREPAARDMEPPDLPREPSLREPSFRAPAPRDPSGHEPSFREPAPREALPREPSLREPAPFAEEPPAARRGGRRRPDSDPDFLELPLLPDLAPQSRPPRGEPARREPELGARYIGPVHPPVGDLPADEFAPKEFAARRADPLPRAVEPPAEPRLVAPRSPDPRVSEPRANEPRMGEPRATFPFRAVAPEPEPDDVIPFVPVAEPPRPAHILARQGNRPMPVATPPAAVAPAPPSRMAEEMRAPDIVQPPAPAVVPQLSRDDMQRLQAALYELQECRRILDGARN